MPHLVKMERKYAKKGLRLIALEAQNSSKEKIEKVVKDQRMKFTVARRSSVPDNEGKGIPHMLVYNVDGTLAWQGHPSTDEAEKAIRTALKKAKPPKKEEDDAGIFAKKTADLVAERDWTNTDGKTLKAALVSIDGDKGTFRRSNGKTFKYDVSKLSEADQTLIKEKAAPKE